MWPEIMHDFDTIVPGRHQQSVDRAHRVPLGGHASGMSNGVTVNEDPFRIKSGKRRSETA